MVGESIEEATKAGPPPIGLAIGFESGSFVGRARHRFRGQIVGFMAVASTSRFGFDWRKQ